MVTKGANGVYDFAESEAGSYVWHKLSSLNHQEIHCAILTERGDVAYNWQTIFNLRSLPLTSKLAAVLDAIDGQLHRIPYLGMGENEYI